MVSLGINMIYYGNSNSRVVLMSELKNMPINRLKSSDPDQAFTSCGYLTCVGLEMSRERMEWP